MNELKTLANNFHEPLDVNVMVEYVITNKSRRKVSINVSVKSGKTSCMQKKYYAWNNSI